MIQNPNLNRDGLGGISSEENEFLVKSGIKIVFDSLSSTGFAPKYQTLLAFHDAIWVSATDRILVEERCRGG